MNPILVVKALVFYKNSDSHRMLVLKRSRLSSCPGMEDLPGGKVEEGEDLTDAIIREIQEETQLAVYTVHQFAVHEWEAPNGKTYHEFLFYAIANTQLVVLTPDEHISYRWITIPEIQESTLHPKIKEIIYANLDIIKEIFLLA